MPYYFYYLFSLVSTDPVTFCKTCVPRVQARPHVIEDSSLYCDSQAWDKLSKTGNHFTLRFLGYSRRPRDLEACFGLWPTVFLLFMM